MVERCKLTYIWSLLALLVDVWDSVHPEHDEACKHQRVRQSLDGDLVKQNCVTKSRVNMKGSANESLLTLIQNIVFYNIHTFK